MSTHPRIMPRIPNTKYIGRPPKEQSIQIRDRPVLKVTDVGGKFLDLNVRLRQIVETDRRKERHATAKHRSIMEVKPRKVKRETRKAKRKQAKRRAITAETQAKAKAARLPSQ